MTRANTEQAKFVPWFAKAGAACSIVPISRFIGPNIFALKGGGYGCLFALTGIDEEGLTDQELESRMRSIEGALRGLPEGSCLYQYTRVMSGYELPRQQSYSNPVTQVFVDDRLTFLEDSAGFRRRLPPPRRRRYALPAAGRVEHPVGGLARQSFQRAQGCCYRLQSGHRCHRCQGKAGVHRQGKSKEGDTARSQSCKESSLASMT